MSIHLRNEFITSNYECYFALGVFIMIMNRLKNQN